MLTVKQSLVWIEVLCELHNIVRIWVLLPPCFDDVSAPAASAQEEESENKQEDGAETAKDPACNGASLGL